MDDVECTRKLFSVTDYANTTNVTTASDHGEISGLELDEVSDLVGSQVDDNGVVNLKMRVATR